jgi:hypothetical protein
MSGRSRLNFAALLNLMLRSVSARGETPALRLETVFPPGGNTTALVGLTDAPVTLDGISHILEVPTEFAGVPERFPHGTGGIVGGRVVGASEK